MKMPVSAVSSTKEALPTKNRVPINVYLLLYLTLLTDSLPTPSRSTGLPAEEKKRVPGLLFRNPGTRRIASITQHLPGHHSLPGLYLPCFLPFPKPA